MLKTVYRVSYERGAAGTMLIFAAGVEDATKKMQRYFDYTPGYEKCVLRSVECLGPLWEDIV